MASRSRSKLVIGREYPHPKENELLAEVIELTKAQMERVYKNGEAFRQVHAKSHGCVKASFTVEPGLPEHLKVGLFTNETSFPAWVRLSNGVSKIQHDNKRDVRGIAIKLLNVPGENLLYTTVEHTTSDLVLASAPFFFSKDLAGFMGLLKISITNKWWVKTYHIIKNIPLLARAVLKVQQKHRHVLGIPYFSATPYQFGDEKRAVKYHLRPSPENKLAYTDEKDPNFLLKNMEATLKENDVSFDFCVQFQEDAEKMPIEDASVVWTSPFIKLATLTIPKQEFDNVPRRQLDYCMTYNVWRCLPAHRPLGGFNRARKFIYRELYHIRSDINKMHMEEPCAGGDFFTDINGTQQK
jgi:catalase